jgi:hypothetical protein
MIDLGINLFQEIAALGGGGGFSITNSLRLNDDDSAYLSRTQISGDEKKFTVSFWIKRGNLVNSTLFAASNLSSFTDRDNESINFLNDKITWGAQKKVGGGAFIFAYSVETQALLRDVSGWYHVVVAKDLSQASASDRIKIYVNGVLQTLNIINAVGTEDTAMNRAGEPAYIGYLGTAAPNHYDGYMAEVNFIDGQQLTADSFGEVDAVTGEWSPKGYSGSRGNNGYYLKMAGNANDSSGNGNNWTENNLASTDYMIDTPTNNFATLNPLSGFGGGTFSEGNLSLNTTPAGNNVSTIAVSSGKWYFEGRVKLDDFYAVGITNEAGVTFSSSISASGSNTVGYWSGGGIYDQGGLVATVASYGTADVVSAAVDMDSGNVKFYKNNVLVYTYTFGVSGAGITFDTLFAAVNGGGGASRSVDVNFGADSSFAGNKTRQGNTDANGIGDFYYAPPAGGYLALCTDNLPEPAIVQPETQFNVVTYTGNSADRNIDLGFEADFVWIKARNSANANRLYDRVRGNGQVLFSDLSNAEFNGVNDGIHFDYANGFNIDVGANVTGYNETGSSYVAWCWKAGGTAVSNTDGSITSQVSANVDAGFSIVSYTGTGAASATVGHGLGQTPAMIIQKAATDGVYNWNSWHKNLDTNSYISLNTTAAQDNSVNVWPTAGITSSVFTTASSAVKYNNLSGVTHIAYCFAEVEGFSKFGSYVGNGSTDGPFVYTSFKPALVLYKRAVGGTGNWILADNEREGYNGDNPALYPNLNLEESIGTSIDLLANGFKILNSASDHNASGSTYIYMAFAEHPFKEALAR